jgi:Kef-type K+ transport system membrane component KefB
MSATLVLILVIALAYLATHVLYDWVARRYRIVSGAEYLVLGVLLGPHVSGIFNDEVLRGFAPLTTLTLGWAGVLAGTQFHLPQMVKVRGRVWTIAFGEAIVTFVVVAGVMTATLEYVYALSRLSAIVPGVTLGAIAASSTPAGVQAAAKLMRSKGPVLEQLEIATWVNNLVAITAFGLLVCWLRRPVLAVEGIPNPTVTEWAVIAIAIGVVGGALFHLFLGNERKNDRLVIGVAGAVILTTGVAAYLRLSPILSALVLGFILVNTTNARAQLEDVLVRAQRPMYFVMLVMAGATWTPSRQTAWLVPILFFLGLRAVAKIGAARLVTRWNGAMQELGPHWGRALVGQGWLGIAIGLDYASRGDTPLPSIVFTAAALSVLLTEFASLRLVASVTEPLLRPLERIPVAGRYIHEELRPIHELGQSGESPVFDPDAPPATATTSER